MPGGGTVGWLAILPHKKYLPKYDNCAKPRFPAGKRRGPLARAPENVSPAGDYRPGLESELLKLDDYLVYRQTDTGLCDDFRHLAILLRLEHVLHLHRFDDRELLTRLDLLPNRDRDLA